MTVGPDGIIRCDHGEQARFSTSGTDKNRGRRFYGCPKLPLSAQCKFFYWEDDYNLRRQIAQVESANETSQPTSAKRKFQSIASPPDTAEKRLRMQNIRAGLREREQDQADALPFTAGASNTQASDTPTEPTQHEERAPRYSFLDLCPSQESVRGAPSTPKRQAPPSQLYGFRAEPSSSRLPTPLETLKPNRVQAQGSSAPRQVPVTPTQHKSASSQWDRFNATDRENPFDEAAGSFGSRLDQERQSSLDSLDTSGTPTTAERIVNAISGLQSAFRTFGDELNQLDSANYIRRLERQNRALEIKNDAKSKRIADLEIDLDVLTEKLRRLEEQTR